MRQITTRLPSMVLASVVGWSGLASADTLAGPDSAPGVEQRELQQVNPDRFRVSPPVDIQIPDLPPMRAVADTQIEANQFVFTGNTAYTDEELTALIADYTGTITFQQLIEATRIISEHYRAEGMIVARAYVPEQEVTTGIVEIVVLEGLLGEIRITGDKPISAERAARRMARLAGDHILIEKDLEYGALLLNDMAGVGASVALQPGVETGTTDVVVELEKESMVDLALDYNNFGAPVTGEHRFGAQIAINSLFNAGDRITLRPIVSEGGETQYGSAGFSMPLFTPATNVGVSYSMLESELGEDFEQLDIENTASSAGLNVTHAFQRSRNRNFSARLAYETREFERECGICKRQMIPIVEDVDYELDVAEIGVLGDWRDEWGGGGLSTWYFNVRRGLSDVKPIDAGITVGSRRRLDGKFTTVRLGGQRLQRLSDNFTLSFRLDGQRSGNDLDPSERISLGGPGGVRAYLPSEALGDSGVVTQTELRMQVPAIADRLNFMTGFEVYLLVDAGASELNDNGDNISRRLNYTRSAWGGGLRITGTDKFYIGLEGAKRLADRESLVDQPEDSETNFWAQAIYWF